jgi:hypothetical protein
MAKSITASVGQGGANRRPDVLTIQEMLNRIAPAQGGPDPKLDVDGWIGPLTVAAIRKFQTRQFGWADGRVDVDQVTIKKLNELGQTPGPDDQDPNRCTCFLPRPRISIGPITIESAPPPARSALELAVSDAPRAIAWARAAAQTLERAINQLIDAGDDTSASTPDLDKANTHFHADLIPNNFAREVLLDRARLNYLDMIRVLSDTDYFFRKGDNVKPNAFAYAHVGYYHIDNKNYKVYFNDTYANCGPKCRAAMVLHECGHYVAFALHYAREGPTLAGTPDVPFADADGHGPTHPRDYAHLFPTESLHNACTYAAFAFHCFDGTDGRPGADHINE